ncbi:MAG: MlaD family protein [Acidobacteriia bacterium]|nr:MlaD family protein [Terriglobia bacterium]
MARPGEEIKVGVVVVVAVVLFLTALVFVGGVNLLRKKKVTYTTYFKFAGGLEPGSFVRFGGFKVGAVQSARIDPEDSTRIRVRLLVDEGTPVRTNSRARISTLGFLGENYVEVSPGTREAPRLAPGSEIPSVEIVQLADVFNNVNNITLNANKLVNDLDDRFLVLADNANQLINNINSITGEENRQHFNSVLANADSLLKDSRPRVDRTLANLETASAKIGPTIDNASATIDKTNVLAGHLDQVVVENRKEIHDSLLQLQTSLADAQRMIGDLDETLNSNRGNLDETLENIRVSSQNLKQFTDTVKQKPFSLIRIKAQKDRLPPTGK